MKHSYILFLLFAITTIVNTNLFAWGGSEESTLSGSIEVAGSSTVYPITSAVAEEFNRLYPEVEIPIRSTGTGGGFKNFFIPGKTDINNASRHMKDSERASAKENGIEPLEIQVAIDAITIVVNVNNPIDNMTVEQLKTIWSPDTQPTNWNEVSASWPSAPFELYGPTSASGTFDYFTEVIVGEGGLSRTDYQKTEQDNTIVQAVQGSVNALGYFGMAYYLENQATIKAVKIEGVEPNLETAKTGVYAPLSRPIFIYVSSKALERPEVQEFMKFYIESTATSLISDVGYVPVTQEIMNANMDKLLSTIQ